MNRLVFLLLATASTSAFAATPIDETIDAETAELLDISNVAGAVTVTGADRSDVRVTGQLSDDAERLDVRRDGNRIIVHVIMPERQGRRDGRRGQDDTTLNVLAPRNLALAVNTVSAAIEVEDMQGEQDLNSVSGSIETAQYEEELRAKTVSGRIRVTGRNGPARADVSSVSGGVELDTVAGELSAQTISGRIELDSDRLERGELRSVSGSLYIDASLTDDGRLNAVTTSGRISLNMRGSAAGRYELSTFSGSIDNCFGPRPSGSRFGPPGATVRFEEGEAESRVEANSMSGSIELCREP